LPTGLLFLFFIAFLLVCPYDGSWIGKIRPPGILGIQIEQREK